MAFDGINQGKIFMNDFVVAEQLFGNAGIQAVFKEYHNKWKDNADYYGSFVMALNHLLWWHYDNGREEKARLYDKLWKKADAFVFEHFKGDDLNKIIAFLD